MKSKALEILRAIAEDKDNTSHSNLSLGYQAAVKAAIHELEQPEEETNALKRIVAEQVEAAINGSFSNLIAKMDERINAMDGRVERIENTDEVDLCGIEERLDELEASSDRDLVSRVDDLESRLDDYDRTSLEDRVADLEKGDNNDEQDERMITLEELVQGFDERFTHIFNRSLAVDRSSLALDERVKALEVKEGKEREATAIAALELIRERLA